MKNFNIPNTRPDNSGEGEPNLDFWAGPDIQTGRNATIDPGERIDLGVILRDVEWPRSLIENSEIMWKQLFTSTKSGLAQLGLEVRGSWDAFEQMVEAHLMDSDPFIFPLSVTNWGYRPVELKEGDNLFRFFACSFRQRLEGEQLTRHIEENGIIDGAYGQDWWFIDKQGQQLSADKSDQDRASIVCLALDTAKRLWVPPSDEPVRLTKREDIDHLLKPIPQNQSDVNFFVTEARASIHMADRPGVLFSDFKPEFDEEPNLYRQTQSVLVEPHFPDYLGRGDKSRKIRAEIVGAEKDALAKPWVYMELW
jgi:hypothetical protein